MAMPLYLSFGLGALLIALVVTPLMRLLAYRVGALDRGTGRRVHDGVVPRLGGGGIFSAFILCALVAIAYRRSLEPVHAERLIGVLVGGVLVFLVGCWDDLRGAPIRNKLAGEAGAAVLLWAWGVRIDVLTNPMGGTISLGWFGLPVTVLWIVVITNAFNLIDGLDGLAAGTGIMIATALLLLYGGQGILLRLCLVILIGALFGFLRYNFPPATIFMGDSGSLLVGYLLGALAIVASFKATAMATVMVPILLFAHPLMDMVYAVLRRYHRGIPLGEPDKEHIHHKLLAMGFSRRRVLGILMAMNVAVILVVAFVVRRQLRGDLLLLLLLLVLSLVGLRLFGYVTFKRFFGEQLRVLAMGRRQRYLRYLIREFAKTAPNCRDIDELGAKIDELLAHSSFTEATVSLVEEGVERQLYGFGMVPVQPGMQVEFPILRQGVAVGRIRLRSSADKAPPCSGELGAALAEGIIGSLDRQSAVSNR